MIFNFIIIVELCVNRISLINTLILCFFDICKLELLNFSNSFYSFGVFFCQKNLGDFIQKFPKTQDFSHFAQIHRHFFYTAKHYFQTESKKSR